MTASTLTKLLWRRELDGVRWTRLAVGAGVACALVQISGLLAFGRDGMAATYAAMVCACGSALWLIGFGPLRR